MYFVILIATCIIILMVVFKTLTSKKKQPISENFPPGPTPTDEDNGNLANIRESGGFHNYVSELHEMYGPIVAFWMGKQRVVSVTSPDLLKQQQQLFDRPVNLFKSLLDLAGENSIQFANGEHGRNLHKTLSRPFAFTYCGNYYDGLHEVSRELVNKLKENPPETHIPIFETMNITAIKGLVRSAFGCSTDDETATEVLRNYEKTWEKNDDSLKKPLEESNIDKMEVKKGIEGFRKFAADILSQRAESRLTDDKERFVDVLLDYGFDNHEKEVDNAATFLIGGFHTTGTLMTWMVYYLATNEEIQERLYRHLVDVLGEKDVTYEDMSNLGYLTQVIDETLRLSQLAPYAARSSSKDAVLNGYKVPADTPILLSLGVGFADPYLWPSPQRFDPDRFSEKNTKSRHPFAFKPFGFAGKRICPGYRFAYVEIAVFLSALMRNFVFRMVAGQNIKPEHGLVTKPDAEVWMTLERR